MHAVPDRSLLLLLLLLGKATSGLPSRQQTQRSLVFQDRTSKKRATSIFVICIKRSSSRQLGTEREWLFSNWEVTLPRGPPRWKTKAAAVPLPQCRLLVACVRDTLDKHG